MFRDTWPKISAMSAPNINRSVLSTTRAPRKDSSNPELNQLSLLARFKVEHAVDQARSQILKEAHQKRLKILRKELDYLKNSAWMYQPVDKFIGQ